MNLVLTSNGLPGNSIYFSEWKGYCPEGFRSVILWYNKQGSVCALKQNLGSVFPPFLSFLFLVCSITELLSLSFHYTEWGYKKQIAEVLSWAFEIQSHQYGDNWNHDVLYSYVYYVNRRRSISDITSNKIHFAFFLSY